jgi:hypothetical protein
MSRILQHSALVNKQGALEFQWRISEICGYTIFWGMRFHRACWINKGGAI